MAGFHFFHQWRTIRDEGVHRYEECVKCKKRQVVATHIKGGGKVDEKWLAGGEWSIWKDIGPPPTKA